MDILLRVLTLLVLCIPVSTAKLPPDMSQAIFCESCSAVMQELNKLLAKKSSDPRELQVVEAMESICQAKYFSKYHYSPPTTIKACKFLIEKYEEDIEQLLIANKGDSEKEVCYKMTKACEGVDRTKKEKEDMDVRFNDQKQEAKTAEPPVEDADGIKRMNVDINDPGAAERLAEQIKQQIGMGGMGGGSYGGNDGDDGDDGDDDDDNDDDDDDDDEDDDASKTKTEL